MKDHAQLTLREIHGPYMQLLTNLQGENGHEWLNALKRFNRKENPWLQVSEPTEQFLTVHPDLTFGERIARGNYSRHDSDLTEVRFPVTGEQMGEWEWKLFHFNRRSSSKMILRKMQEEGYEPGCIGHILTFGEKCPKEYPIIALGSVSAVIDRGRMVPKLDYGHSGHYSLSLNWSDDNWDSGYCFLGVRRIG